MSAASVRMSDDQHIKLSYLMIGTTLDTPSAKRVTSYELGIARWLQSLQAARVVLTPVGVLLTNFMLAMKSLLASLQL